MTNSNMPDSPKKDLKVCIGLSCTRNFSKDIVRRAKKHKNAVVSTCCCMGLCGLAPNIMLDGSIISEVNPSKIDSIIDGEISGEINTQNQKSSIAGPPILDDDGLESVNSLLDI